MALNPPPKQYKRFTFDLSFDDENQNQRQFPDGKWIPEPIESLPKTPYKPSNRLSDVQQRMLANQRQEHPEDRFVLGFGTELSKKDEAIETHAEKDLANNKGSSPSDGHGEEGLAENEEAPNLLTFTEDEILNVRDDAYNEGFEQGLKEGREKAEEMKIALHDDLLERLISELQAKTRIQQQNLEGLSLLAMRVLKASLQKLMPIVLKKHGEIEVLEVFRNSLKRLSSISKLRISYHPDHDEGLRPQIMAIAEKQNIVDMIRIITDENLMHGDVEIDWGNGGISRHYEEIVKEIEAAVNLMEENTQINNPNLNDTSAVS